MPSEFAAVTKWAKTLEEELTGKGAEQRMRLVGQMLKREVNDGVRAELGDLSMSGWRRKRPIDIVGQAIVPNVDEIIIRPTKPGRGPMRVLDQGRNQGQFGGFAGPGVNRRTGGRNFTKTGKVARMRSRRGRRWNGTTDGRGTWGNVEKAIADRAGAAIHEVRVLYAIRKTVGKG